MSEVMSVDQAIRLLHATSAPEGADQDAAKPRVKEVITLRKFDKTDVSTPGVAGLTPFEEIVVEDGQIVAVRREGLDPEPDR